MHDTEAAIRHVVHDHGWPTTRTYPRSLSDAFRDERAPAVQVYRRPMRGVVPMAVAIVAGVALVGVGLAIQAGG